MNTTTIFLAFATMAVTPLSAQLAPPNSAGATMGHIHLGVRDIEVQQRFWVQLGGTLVNNEKAQLIQFPGVYILLRKQDSTGGSVGSVINHFGFHVKNIKESLARWKRAGINASTGNAPGQAFLTAPDDIRVEIIEDTSLSIPIAMHHVHLRVTDPLAAQAWYVKNFGAVAGSRNNNPTATMPGAELAFTKADVPQAPSKGRSIDHIGFELSDIDLFARKLQAVGIQTDAPIRTSQASSKIRIGYVTDPWGTYIELSEGLSPAPASVH